MKNKLQSLEAKARQDTQLALLAQEGRQSISLAVNMPEPCKWYDVICAICVSPSVTSTMWLTSLSIIVFCIALVATAKWCFSRCCRKSVHAMEVKFIDPSPFPEVVHVALASQL